jgi:hypothetical protein
VRERLRGVARKLGVESLSPLLTCVIATVSGPTIIQLNVIYSFDPARVNLYEMGRTIGNIF